MELRIWWGDSKCQTSDKRNCLQGAQWEMREEKSVNEGQVTRRHGSAVWNTRRGRRDPLTVLNRMMCGVRRHMSASFHGLGCSAPAENPSGAKGDRSRWEVHPAAGGAPTDPPSQSSPSGAGTQATPPHLSSCCFERVPGAPWDPGCYLHMKNVALARTKWVIGWPHVWDPCSAVPDFWRMAQTVLNSRHEGLATSPPFLFFSGE